MTTTATDDNLNPKTTELTHGILIEFYTQNTSPEKYVPLKSKLKQRAHQQNCKRQKELKSRNLLCFQICHFQLRQVLEPPKFTGLHQQPVVLFSWFLLAQIEEF